MLCTGQLQERYCTTRMLSRSRIAKIDDDGDETRLSVKSALPLLYAIYLVVYPPLFPSSSPVVQLGLISTRKREIAIGADEYVRSAAVSIDTHSLSPFDFPQNHRPCYYWTVRARVSSFRACLFLPSDIAYIGSGLISMSTRFSLYGRARRIR